MERTWTSELPRRPGERVLLKGWLHRVARMVGAANVREVTAFPRDLARLSP